MLSTPASLFVTEHVSDSLVIHAQPLCGRAMVDGGYSSIMAESLARDEGVLTVEPGNRKRIKTVVIRCKK